jgi:hypothetical protein
VGSPEWAGGGTPTKEGWPTADAGLGVVGPPSAAGVAPGTDNKSFNMATQATQDKLNSNSPVSPILSILYINVNFPFFCPAPAGWNPQQHPFPNTSVGLTSLASHRAARVTRQTLNRQKLSGFLHFPISGEVLLFMIKR